MFSIVIEHCCCAARVCDRIQNKPLHRHFAALLPCVALLPLPRAAPPKPRLFWGTSAVYCPVLCCKAGSVSYAG